MLKAYEEKRIRQGHRAYCQRIIDDIDGLLSEATLDKDTLLVKTASLDQQREKIKTLDDEIEVLTDEDDLLTEIQEAGECMARYSIVLQRAQKACNSSPGSNDQQHSNSAADKVAQLRQQSNLPRLELPTFSGDVMEFHTFWDLFKSAVHDKHDIADAEKFQYLKAQLKGVALKAINGLRVAADNYSVAVDILLEKYGNTDVIIDAHMLAFVDMKCSGYSCDELEEFRTELETHVRELEALEVQANEYERMLCPVAMEKLPAKAKEHLVRWIGRQTMTLKDLREFLSEEVKTLKAYEPRVRRQPRMGVRQKRTTFQARGTDMCCVLCGSQHTQERCQMFQAMSVPQRLDVCREHGLCYRCLGKRHVSRDCTVSVVCEVGGCRGAHHTLLHVANREVPPTGRRETRQLSQFIPTRISARRILPQESGSRDIIPGTISGFPDGASGLEGRGTQPGSKCFA